MLHDVFKTVLIAFWLIILPIIGNAQSISSNNLKLENSVKAYLRRLSVPGAAVLVYRDGKLEQYLFGYSDLQQNTPITADTLFELGSVTKSFTGLLLAQQVRAGKVRLNDKWAGFLPQSADYSSATKAITLLELATYTAGLPKDIKGLPYNAANKAEYQKILTQFLQNWSPDSSNTQMLYSNLSFSLLGIALTRNTNQSLAHMMQSDIFIPLKMPSATLNLLKGDKNYARYAQGYDAKGQPARTADGGFLASSWALKASLADMEGYLKAAVGDPTIPPTILAAMRLAQTGFFRMPTTANKLQLGLGWFIIPLNQLSQSDLVTPAAKKPVPRPVESISAPQFNAHSLIDKTGATNGFRAYIGVIPDQHLGVVILTNKFTYHGGALRDLGRTLLVGMSSFSDER